MAGVADGGLAEDAPARPRSPVRIAVLAILGLMAFSLFASLGVWQVERRAWKLDLIARVDARVHSTPAPFPSPDAWPALNAADDEYRRVTITGAFERGKDTLVQAVTDLGPGFWVMTPLKTSQGFTVLVNRGFVPEGKSDPASRAAGDPTGEVTIVGLLRMTEPKGGFLRANDPENDRWRSRDVAAIAAKRGIVGSAPVFVDADAKPNAGELPVGGLTIIAFRNEHLVYALTWFGLALLVLVAGGIVARHEIRARKTA